jgi:hypothetical protein
MHIEQALAGYTPEQICQCADEPMDADEMEPVLK